MRAKAFPGEDPAPLPSPDDIAPMFVELCLPSLAANGETFSFRDWKAKAAKAPKPEPVAVAAEAAPEAESTES